LYTLLTVFNHKKMYKKILSILSIVALLSITGCQSNVNLGQFLGELACLTAQTDGAMTIEEIDSIGDANGFDDETEVTKEINKLSQAELDAELVIAMAHIETVCTEDFENAEVDPKAFLDDFIASFKTIEEESTETVEDNTEDTTEVSTDEAGLVEEDVEAKDEVSEDTEESTETAEEETTEE